MVIADTSVWIPFFNRPDSAEKISLDMLIDADEVALVGVVLAELLQGCRTPSERTVLSESLLALRYFEVTQTTWLRTGDLSHSCSAKASRCLSRICSSPPWQSSTIAAFIAWILISRRFQAYDYTCRRRPDGLSQLNHARRWATDLRLRCHTSRDR